MVTVIINGVTYYVPVDYVAYIEQVDDTLTLSKSGSVTLYSSLTSYNSYDGYPRVTLTFGQKGRYITRSGNYTNTVDLVVNSYQPLSNSKILYNNEFSSLILLLCIFFVLVLNFFKR